MTIPAIDQALKTKAKQSSAVGYCLPPVQRGLVRNV